MPLLCPDIQKERHLSFYKTLLRQGITPDHVVAIANRCLTSVLSMRDQCTFETEPREEFDAYIRNVTEFRDSLADKIDFRKR